MMRLSQGLCALCVVLAGVAPSVAETYGEGVTLEEATPIAELMADPGGFDGRTVRVEGKVNAVCERMGCWLLL